MVAPVVPGLTDEEMPGILRAARDAGACRAGYIVLRLPGIVATLFEEWVHREFPMRASAVMSRIRSVRNGRLNSPEFGVRMSGTGPWAKLFRQIFRTTTRRLGIDGAPDPLATHCFRRRQGELF
jgi:DNA repair photolyase